MAWLDGRFLPAGELAVPIGDAGFVLGATVTEQLRTFSGSLFLPDRHAHRMERSLAIAGIDVPMPLCEVFEAARQVAQRNFTLQPKGHDLGVCVLATPGDLPSQHEARPGRPRVIVHAFPLAFRLWADAYATGVKLVGVSIRQIPEACWPSELKCRSRMHYHLADREAARTTPGAKPLLCHADGRVSETSTANVVTLHGRTLSTPSAGDALQGVSLWFLEQLAGRLGLHWTRRPLSIDDCLAADEMLLTSSPNCLLPAVSLDGRAIGSGVPGPVFKDLLAAWSDEVGLDIAAQARAFR